MTGNNFLTDTHAAFLPRIDALAHASSASGKPGKALE
jgi:hypothetical protein